MGQITPNISIYIPDSGETNYAQSFQAGMINIDQHDHTGAPFKGVPIPSGGIANGAITLPKLDVSLYDFQPYVPDLSFGGAAVGLTYAVQNGKYLKFGDICYVYIEIALSSKGISVGDASVTLPLFGSGFDALTCAIANAAFVPGYSYVNGQVFGGDALFVQSGSALPAFPLSDAQFTNLTSFIMSGVYFIN